MKVDPSFSRISWYMVHGITSSVARMSRVGNSGPDRRLFIGTGIGGMGVQCGVDVPGPEFMAGAGHPVDWT